MAKKILNLPAPVDEEGNELSAEQLEEIALEPTYVPVELQINERKITTHVACDFDQVDRDADHSYQLMKAQQYKLVTDSGIGAGRKRRNSKLTHLKHLEEEIEEGDDTLSGDQLIKITEMTPKQRMVFIGIAFPKDHQKNPVILEGGYDVPGMPKPYNELRPWFEKGGRTADAVLDAIVIAYDPTGPLAQARKAAAEAEKEPETSTSDDSESSTWPANTTTETETSSEVEPEAPEMETSEEATTSEDSSTPSLGLTVVE